MIATASPIEQLKRARPEWMPWLAVLEEIGRECTLPHWHRSAPAESPADGRRVPLLAGAATALHMTHVRRLLDRLFRLASASGTDAMRTLATVRASRIDCAELFSSSVRHDSEAVSRIAAAEGADPEALQAVVALLPVPWLQACNRSLRRAIPANWTRGCCPLCGSWPAFVEMRGIERSRHFRCARCGSEWPARALVCAFCDMSDHDELATLVPAKSDANAVVDACNACRGYVKVFTRLQGCAPATVMIEDLASVDLDMAALEHGYARPAGAGHPVEVTVLDTGRRRFLGWGS